jgi:hypothetical protein
MPSLETDKVIAFYGNDHAFSNHYPSKYKIDEIEFWTSEQGLMYEKAVLFGDAASMLRILCSKDPVMAKRFGRAVSGFKEDVWAANRERLMLKHLRAKFEQNPLLQFCLLSTGDRSIVEGSPKDGIWGAKANLERSVVGKYTGLNILGLLLEQLRDELRNVDKL